jgi:hypothetical protein
VARSGVGRYHINVPELVPDYVPIDNCPTRYLRCGENMSVTARPSGKCIFCGEEGELTAEHPISARVLRLSGFELGDVFVPLDIPLTEMTTEWLVHNIRTVADEFVTCVCAPCNNGWMQNLDHSFAGTIERWTANPSDRLGTVGLRVVQRYLLKVTWVRVLGEAWTGALISEASELIPEVILNPSFGPLIRAGKIDDIVPSFSIGAAKIPNETMFTSAKFTPMIEGVPPHNGMRRFSAGIVVALPKIEVQLWAVLSLSEVFRTSWPAAVQPLAASTRFAELATAASQPCTDDVVLRHG